MILIVPEAALAAVQLSCRCQRIVPVCSYHSSSSCVEVSRDSYLCALFAPSPRGGGLCGGLQFSVPFPPLPTGRLHAVGMPSAAGMPSACRQLQSGCSLAAF